jgi:hypothetical protein
MKLLNIKNTITLAAGRGGFILRKYSPEILMTVGIAGVITSTVMACKATLKADGVIEKAKEKIDKIHYAHENLNEVTDKDGEQIQYTEEDYKKDMAIVYTQTAVDFIKLYGPDVTIGIASIGCILGAHGIMRKRNLALIAAYKTIEQSFAEYRKRVVDEMGVEADKHFKYGTAQIKKTTIDENGNETEETISITDPNGVSQYARYYDESCREWSNIPEYNLTFLRCQQSYANNLLHSRGHVFLNEIYDMLGIPRTKDGAVVGWVKDGNGDNYIDFGIYETSVGYANDHDCDTVGEIRRDFVNGYRNVILLDFNVDGVIYDMI